MELCTERSTLGRALTRSRRGELASMRYISVARMCLFCPFISPINDSPPLHLLDSMFLAVSSIKYSWRAIPLPCLVVFRISPSTSSERDCKRQLYYQLVLRGSSFFLFGNTNINLHNMWQQVNKSICRKTTKSHWSDLVNMGNNEYYRYLTATESRPAARTWLQPASLSD